MYRYYKLSQLPVIIENKLIYFSGFELVVHLRMICKAYTAYKSLYDIHVMKITKQITNFEIPGICTGRCSSVYSSMSS